MQPMHRVVLTIAGAIAVGVGLLASAPVAGQTPGDIPGRCADPPTTRAGEIGCYLLSNELVEALPAGPLFWHIYTYATRSAAELARTDAPGAVVEAFGKVWRFTIAAEGWRPPSGGRAGVVGPLEVPRAAAYRARFMEGTFPPNRGMLTTIHRHSGPEAWFVISGAQCLRTTSGTVVLRAGEGGTVPSGPSMVLTSIGPEIRRSFVLVLHDASQPWQTNTSEWKPTTECPER